MNTQIDSEDFLTPNLLLLQSFIKQFLPGSNTKGKYSHNHSYFVHSTINKLFSHHQKITFSQEEILKCFSLSGYSIYISEKKAGRPKSNHRNDNSTFTDSDDDFFEYAYLGISSRDVLNLKRVNGSLGYFKNPELKEQLLILKKQIEVFFEKALKNSTL